MFAATRKTAYSQVIALPKLNEVIAEVKRNRVLLIIDPATKMPPEQLGAFFAELPEKNNLLVLTGDKTQMASIEQAARKSYATLKAEVKIPKSHAQYEEFLGKKESAAHDFYSTILGVFDKVIYPAQVGDKTPELKVKPLDSKRDNSKPFDGEEQIEKTLTAHPRKLFLDVDADFDALRDYPRSKYNEITTGRVDPKAVTVVQVEFELDDEDRAAIPTSMHGVRYSFGRKLDNSAWHELLDAPPLPTYASITKDLSRLCAHIDERAEAKTPGGSPPSWPECGC
jgi:hypothetical protein